MDRRHFLKTGGIALAGFGLAGCRPKQVVQTAPTRPAVPAFAPRPALDLMPPRITWDRVIRTTIGLRPHRDSGFVLKGVKFDDKGQNVLASSVVTQLQGGKYLTIYPKARATANVILPYKGW